MKTLDITVSEHIDRRPISYPGRSLYGFGRSSDCAWLDRYGPLATPMFMSIIDVESLDSPEEPEFLNGNVYYEERPQRRNPRGSNLWYDQATLRVLYELSRKSGIQKFADSADAYINATFARATKTTGLLIWGFHIFYDAFLDKAGGDLNGNGDGPHEILIYHPEWAELYRCNPEATRAEVEGIWEWHIVDKSTGQHNRHDDKTLGLDFAFSGGSFILANAAFFKLTGEAKYMERAKRIAQWHWDHRNLQTGVIPDTRPVPASVTMASIASRQ